MSIAEAVINHLEKKSVEHLVVKHPHSSTSLGSARTAHIDANQIAKGVLVKKTDGSYLLTVLPASFDLDVKAVEEALGEPISFATENELPHIFPDCEMGAVPAIGTAYGLETLVDTRLKTQPDIYFEAGDREKLIHINESQFEKLLGNAQYEHISKEIL